MKLLHYFSAIFFLLFTLSHALHFDIISENHDNHDDHDHLIKSSSSNGGDSLIRLPVEVDDNKQQPQLKTTSSSVDRVTDVNQYLTDSMNRRPVLLRNRFRFPRRCHHRFGPAGRRDEVVASMLKKQAEVVRHRHVAGRFGEEQEFFIIPLKHFHRMHHHDHHDDHHEGEVDQTVEMKREEYEIKEEYDGGWKGHHDHDHDHDHHEHHDHHEKEESEIMKKIRKFLPHF
ncbi:hypothetical protein RND81_06G248700 [Saponaria officinalis]|uniref:Uncharacterized protein n=1 Tax=Saponaria officinalis TaxID=3572 RepID=A0AAW1KDY9_SAPOF